MTEQRHGGLTSPWIESEHDQSIKMLFDAFPDCLHCFPKDSMIYGQGEHGRFVYAVKSGRVRLVLYSSEGNAFHLFIIKPGGLFGETAYLDGQAENNSAEAVVNSEVCQIPYAAFDGFVERVPAFRTFLLLSVSRKLRAATQVIDNLVTKSASSLVVTYLKYLAVAHGEKMNGDSVRIGIRFTHDDIASITNLSRVTVSNVLGELSRQGIIGKAEGQYYIRSLRALDKMVGN